MHGLPIITTDGCGLKNMFYNGINAKIAKV